MATGANDASGARIAAQMAFLQEADRLKAVLRATTLADGSRRENSGEHSWHLALYAMVLADQASPGVSLDRVIRMLLIHDLVEIDVGDVPIHSADGAAHGSAAVLEAERAAATRIFGLLPSDLRDDLLALWRSSRRRRRPTRSLPRASTGCSR
jgi:putative hydrolase of HD superfamily